MSKSEPGYSITATEPLNGIFLMQHTCGAWRVVDVQGNDIYDDRRVKVERSVYVRWDYLPGDSPLERVLALDPARYTPSLTLEHSGLYSVLITDKDGTQYQGRGSTPNSAAVAALAEKGE